MGKWKGEAIRGGGESYPAQPGTWLSGKHKRSLGRKTMKFGVWRWEGGSSAGRLPLVSISDRLSGNRR